MLLSCKIKKNVSFGYPFHTNLRFLNLHKNRFNDTISPLLNCTSLELLYLSRNDFNVEILTKISSLCLLLRLDIYDNNIRGPIPTQRTKQTHLLTLRLQNNALSGHVPDLSASLLNLTVQNVTNNELRSHVPDSMLTVLFGNHALSSVGPPCYPNALKQSQTQRLP